MAFDWTSVEAGDMAVAHSGALSGDRGGGGVWRQACATLEMSNDEGSLAVWLKELGEWSFDSLTLNAEADAWVERMEGAHLVLMRHDIFERAACGLEWEKKHRHRRLCAGPSAAEKRARRLEVIREAAERRAAERRRVA